MHRTKGFTMTQLYANDPLKRLIQFSTLLGAVSVAWDPNNVTSDQELEACVQVSEENDDHHSTCSSCRSADDDASSTIDELLDSLPSLQGPLPIATCVTAQPVGKSESESTSSLCAEITTTTSDNSRRRTSYSDVLRTFLLTKADGGSTSSFPSFLLPEHFLHRSTDSNVQAKRAKATHRDEKEQEQRHELEETAAQFLSQSMLVEPCGSLTSDGGDANTAVSDGIADVPQVMLLNIQDTFRRLIDARLRAYATILLRHSEQLVASEKKGGVGHDEGILSGSAGALVKLNNQKLIALLQMIQRISIDTTVTSFIPCIDGSSAVKEGERTGTTTDDDELVGSVTLGVRMQTIMDIVMNVGVLEGEAQFKVMTVKFGAPGVIIGRFPRDASDRTEGQSMMRDVRLTIDSHIMLESMMEEARHVGLCAVNHVNSLFHHLYTEDDISDDEEPSVPRTKFVCPIHEAEEQEREDKTRRAKSVHSTELLRR